MPRKHKSQDGNPYEVIRGMWEGAYVSHFVRLLGKKFGFSCVTTQYLEEALVEDNSVTLADIFARLLRYLTGNVDILIANFEPFLRNLLIKEKAEVPRFLENGITWHDLTPEEKLGILKWLIDHVYKEKEEDIADYLDENYSADDLRGICAGQDAFNNVYWYLDDFRLYREFPHKKQYKKDWECVCRTLSDWQSFIKQFRKTSNLQEKELYTYLNFELFPIVEIELLHKRTCQNKEEVGQTLIKQEHDDLNVMLDKNTFLECNNSAMKSEENGSNSICVDKQNCLNNETVKVSGESENIPDFLSQCEENAKSTMNYCDGHLNISESVCSVNNSSLSSSTMNINSCELSMCVSSGSSNYVTSCNSTHDSCSISTNSATCEKSTNDSCTSVSTVTSVAPFSQENAQEATLQQPLSDIPSDSSSVTSNKENAPPSSGNIGNDIPPMSAISNMVGSTSTPITTASVQPLPSNMVNKTSFQMETQYMQQQSQIFVFSTALANKAAESYLSGHYPSIIAFHCAQPGTKSILDKYPLKVQQFNKQNPAAWLNTLAQLKQSGRQMKPPVNQFPGPRALNSRFQGPSTGSIMSPCSGFCSMHSPGLPRGPPWPSNCGGPNNCGGPSMPNDMCSQPWPNQQFPQPSSSENYRFQHPQRGPSGSPLLGCPNPGNGPTSFPNQGPNSMAMNQSPSGSLTGVKVPDENLTPQQRQHREEQLATIRKMHQMLFPEQQRIEAAQAGLGPSGMAGIPHQNVPNMRFGAGEMCMTPGMETCFSPHYSCLNEHEHSHQSPDMYVASNSGIGPNFPPQNFSPNSMSAQVEWQKLQSQFYEERRKKVYGGTSQSSVEPEVQPGPITQVQPMQTSQQSMSQPPTPQQPNANSSSPNVGLSPSARMQGPPPPYHRRTMPSPHPSSPNTSSLSLPSPHMVSSPADSSRQFPIPGPRMPHPSSGPATPVSGNSVHTTPLNSPKTSRTPASTPTSTPTSSCIPILPNSGPGTPASSRKQSDIQDSNSSSSTTTISTDFSTPNNSQDLFGSNLHSSCSKSTKPDNCNNHSGVCPKEPSLMPVPSPQQIQYLNAFDGQELTIQKQPNTSIRDIDMSPASIPPSMVLSSSQYQSPEEASFPNTPGSCPSVLENSQDSLSGRYPVSTPAGIDVQPFPASSPQMAGFDSGSRHMIPPNDSIPRFPGASSVDMNRMSGPSTINHNPLDDSGNPFSTSIQPSIGFNPGPVNKNNMSRFPMSAATTLQMFRGPSPHSNMDITSPRFMGPSPHMSCIDTMSQSSQLSMGSESMPNMSPQSFQNSTQGMLPGNGSCVNKLTSDGNMPHSHLQNLQKMAPPFDSMAGNKIPTDIISPMGQCSNQSANNSNNIMSMPSFEGSTPTHQTVASQRLSHFDPIASMAAMGESTVPLVTASGSAPNNQDVITTNMQTPTSNVPHSQNNMVNFHSNLMQSTACSMPNPRPVFSASNQMTPNVCCAPQNVNTYVNSTMQQMNFQNSPTTASFHNNQQDVNMSPHAMHGGCLGNGANTISSVTTNHPIMHTAVTSRTNSSMAATSGPRLGPPSFPGQPRAPGNPMMARGLHYNSSNAQVKSGAPNTIQYLPARQNLSSVPGRGSTIEYLQRFAAPLTNLDNKVPTHNLQYFPNSGGSHPPVGLNVGPNMMNSQRPVNMMMMRGPSLNASHPGGQMYPVGAGDVGASSMYGCPPCPSGNMPINAMGNSQMFRNKHMPLLMGGMAPDATQPLPPSMGQSFSYKQAPFYGPTTADPNYAVQFHNFQQQLYATNTRGSQQNNMSSQGFFGTK